MYLSLNLEKNRMMPVSFYYLNKVLINRISLLGWFDSVTHFRHLEGKRWLTCQGHSENWLDFSSGIDWNCRGKQAISKDNILSDM